LLVRLLAEFREELFAPAAEPGTQRRRQPGGRDRAGVVGRERFDVMCRCMQDLLDATTSS
jgi:hypothetical protein